MLFGTIFRDSVTYVYASVIAGFNVFLAIDGLITLLQLAVW